MVNKVQWQMGWESWSSGYGKRERFAFQRSWVRIPAPYTGWTFFTYICCKYWNNVFLKRLKMNEKEAGVGPFFLKKSTTTACLKDWQEATRKGRKWKRLKLPPMKRGKYFWGHWCVSIERGRETSNNLSSWTVTTLRKKSMKVCLFGTLCMLKELPKCQ